MFEGFEPANTTPVPDVLFDQLLSELSGAELKVLLYIIRRTWGFKKQTDAISLNQFTDGIITKDKRQLDGGCGVTNRSALLKALTALEARGYITSIKGKDPLGDAATTLYSIHFRVVQKTDYPPLSGSAKNGLPVVQKTDYRSAKNAPGVVQKTHPQETVLQQTEKQETVRQVGVRAGAVMTQAAPEPDHTHTSPLPVGDFEEDGITDLEEEDETPTEARIPAVQAAPTDTPSQGADGRESPPAVVGQPVAPVPPGQRGERGAQPPAGQSPPMRGKAPVIPIAAMRLLDDWDREYGPSGRPKWVIDAAIDIVQRLHGDIGKVMQVVTKIEAKKLNRSGRPLNLEFVANHWGLLAERQPPPKPANAPNIGRDGKTDLNVYGIDALLRRQERRGPLFTQEELEAAAALLGEAI